MHTCDSDFATEGNVKEGGPSIGGSMRLLVGLIDGSDLQSLHEEVRNK